MIMIIVKKGVETASDARRLYTLKFMYNSLIEEAVAVGDRFLPPLPVIIIIIRNCKFRYFNFKFEFANVP